jgi:hypothetical protein
MLGLNVRRSAMTSAMMSDVGIPHPDFAGNFIAFPSTPLRSRSLKTNKKSFWNFAEICVVQPHGPQQIVPDF